MQYEIDVRATILKLIKALTKQELDELCSVYFNAVYSNFGQKQSFNEQQLVLLDHVDKHRKKIPSLLKGIEERDHDISQIISPEEGRKLIDECDQNISRSGSPEEIQELLEGTKLITALKQKQDAEFYPDLKSHYSKIISALTKGELVFFLGSDFNRFGRSQGSDSIKYPPTTEELVKHLIKKCSASQHFHELQCPLTGLSTQCPLTQCSLGDGSLSSQNSDTLICEDTTLICPVNEAKAYIGNSLNHIAQYARLEEPGDFSIAVQEIFEQKYLPTDLHTFLAALPAKLRDKGYLYPYQLIVTSNYDDVLEQAFRHREPPEEFDVIYYDKNCTKFIYKSWEEKILPIDIPNEFSDFSLTKRTVILKINGSYSSFLMTENDYINYLISENLFKKLPLKLRNKLCCNYEINKENVSRILFLGYLLKDWNARIFLNLFWKLKESEKNDVVDVIGDKKRNTDFRSWAIHYDQDGTKTVDLKLWQIYQEIDVIKDISEEKYIQELDREISELPPYGG